MVVKKGLFLFRSGEDGFEDLPVSVPVRHSFCGLDVLVGGKINALALQGIKRSHDPFRAGIAVFQTRFAEENVLGLPFAHLAEAGRKASFNFPFITHLIFLFLSKIFTFRDYTKYMNYVNITDEYSSNAN
ncbi:MAG: hypothetical protein KGL10_01360 [Alphaproteobacteria bacterium]|nr:hypothetical protein [Alphaproteobacteria bacterium]